MTDKGEPKFGEDMATVNGLPTKVMPGSGNTGINKYTNAHTHKHRQTDTPTPIQTHSQRQTNTDRYAHTHHPRTPQRT